MEMDKEKTYGNLRLIKRMGAYFPAPLRGFPTIRWARLKTMMSHRSRHVLLRCSLTSVLCFFEQHVHSRETKKPRATPCNLIYKLFSSSTNRFNVPCSTSSFASSPSNNGLRALPEPYPK